MPLRPLHQCLPAVLALCSACVPAFARDASAIAELSLEELTRLPVTSVGKRTQQLSEVAGSVYVIRQDDIRRSGATSLPELLRLAPNLQVARANGWQYAITARTGADILANKMLVLVDGRTVYSPLFSGVFWDAEDLVLEDIDRIEVLSGSGGTLYGSNAFHGVINVITKAAGESNGWNARAAAGNRERVAAARFGQLSEGQGWRLSAKRRLLDANRTTAGTAARDAGNRSQLDLRWDAGTAESQTTFEAGVFQQKTEDVLGYRAYEGSHMLARWLQAGPGARTQLQAYVDRRTRDRSAALRNTVETVDLEGQQEVGFGSHVMVWGGGARVYRDDASPYNPAALDLVPRVRQVRLVNVFTQGDISISDALRLVPGLKAEHNSYTGLEWLPGVRLAYQPAGSNGLLWAAASRVVRTPARVDVEVRSPPLLPSPGFTSEKGLIYELGYRGRAVDEVTYSATLFHHRYSDLRSFDLSPAGGTFGNGFRGTLTGLESWAEWRVRSAWRLRAGLTLQNPDYRRSSAAVAAPPETTLGNDARHKLQFSSSLNLADGWSFDLYLRKVGSLPNPAVPAYSQADARLAWQAGQDLEVALVGSSLLHARHVEWATAAQRVQLSRSLMASVVWRQ